MRILRLFVRTICSPTWFVAAEHRLAGSPHSWAMPNQVFTFLIPVGYGDDVPMKGFLGFAVGFAIVGMPRERPLKTIGS
jgi:hypothetical protein